MIFRGSKSKAEAKKQAEAESLPPLEPPPEQTPDPTETAATLDITDRLPDPVQHLREAPPGEELGTEGVRLDDAGLSETPGTASEEPIDGASTDFVMRGPLNDEPAQSGPPHADPVNRGSIDVESPSDGPLNRPPNTGLLNTDPLNNSPLNSEPRNAEPALDPNGSSLTADEPPSSESPLNGSVSSASHDTDSTHSEDMNGNGERSTQNGSSTESDSLPARVQDPNLHIASMSGRQVAALRRRDAKDVCFVDCLVLPVEALQATPNSVGPYTFPSSEAAQAFIDETLETLQVLGCAIQRTKEHVR